MEIDNGNDKSEVNSTYTCTKNISKNIHKKPFKIEQNNHEKKQQTSKQTQIT